MCPMSVPSSVCSGSISAVAVYLMVCLPLVQVSCLLAGSGTGCSGFALFPSFMVTVKEGLVSAMMGSFVANGTAPPPPTGTAGRTAPSTSLRPAAPRRPWQRPVVTRSAPNRRPAVNWAADRAGRGALERLRKMPPATARPGRGAAGAGAARWRAG